MNKNKYSNYYSQNDFSSSFFGSGIVKKNVFLFNKKSSSSNSSSKSENNKLRLTHALIFLEKSENLQEYTHRRGQKQNQKMIMIIDRQFETDSEEKQQPWASESFESWGL